MIKNSRILRSWLAGVALATAMAAGTNAGHADTLPIVFVHGDSDTSALWVTQIWRFESNGYPKDRIFALDLKNPGAPNDDRKPGPNRSTTKQAAEGLKALVEKVLAKTGAQKVALVGNSRGCSTIRNYVQNFGGAAKTAKMVMSGCVYHGVFNFPGAAEGSEYNGQGIFLKKLNAGTIIPPGVDVTTIRSDKFDLYNQPKGDFIGMAGKPIGGRYDGPVLKGANNIVLEGADHRETAFSARAFAKMYKAITGNAPKTTDVSRSENLVLNGKVTGWQNDRPTNIALTGATVKVFPTDPATGKRKGAPVHERKIAADGLWGPFNARQGATYEFEITAEGHPITHIYRSPFPRSTNYVNLRLYPLEKHGKANTTSLGMMRPRGYFGPRQDKILLNGKPAPVIIDHDVPGYWKVYQLSDKPVTVTGSFNGEKITGQTWPVKGHAAWLELTN